MPVGFRTEYKAYKTDVKNLGKQLSQELGTKFTINPTSRRICRKNGIEAEQRNSVNTANFLKAVYELLKSKGYQIPRIYLDESQLPRKRNVSGMQIGNENVYGPGRLEVSSPALVIHEEGHFLHKKNLKLNQVLYSQICAIRSIFRPFLNKKEREILKQDVLRAYNEGYYDLQLDKCLKKGYVTQKQIDQFNEKPEELLSRNMFMDVSEFVGDYFALAARGFKFSPEIDKRYEKFHGPEIKEIITRDEDVALQQYRDKLTAN